MREHEFIDALLSFSRCITVNPENTAMILDELAFQEAPDDEAGRGRVASVVPVVHDQEMTRKDCQQMVLVQGPATSAAALARSIASKSVKEYQTDQARVRRTTVVLLTVMMAVLLAATALGVTTGELRSVAGPAVMALLIFAGALALNTSLVDRNRLRVLRTIRAGINQLVTDHGWIRLPRSLRHCSMAPELRDEVFDAGRRSPGGAEIAIAVMERRDNEQQERREERVRAQQRRVHEEIEQRVRDAYRDLDDQPTKGNRP